MLSRNAIDVARMLVRLARSPDSLRRISSATGMANYVHICDALGRHADLLLEVLVGNPPESYVGKFFERHRIDFGIVNRNAHMQGVMIYSRVAFLHTHIRAMRVTGRVKPGPFIHADRIDNEYGVSHPMAHGIAIPARRRSIFGFNTLGKLSTIHPDFPPDSLVLIQHNHTVR